MHHPAVISNLRINSQHSNVNDSDAAFFQRRHQTCSTEWIWHSSYQHITGFKLGTAEPGECFLVDPAIRLVQEHTVAYVCELQEANVSVRILIFAFNPVSIHEET